MKRTGTFLLCAIGALLICLSGLQQPGLLRMRAVHHAGVAELENASPAVTFILVALGGFRGLLADMLWLRISHLQDQGDFFEIVQLADWVAKLQPRSADVWQYHAWNMAYNVSAMMPGAEDQWRWILNGLSLLRDNGILYDPDDPEIYVQLGWIFQHKIGSDTADEHLYYKLKWAEAMSAFFPGGAADWDALWADPERLQRLKGLYRLDPDLMQAVEARYGAMDWRMPESHAIYWAWLGLQRSGRPYVNADRMIYQSLADLFREGKLLYDAAEGRYLTFADPARFPYVAQAYEDAIPRYPEDSTVGAAYTYFLWDATVILHIYGMDVMAADAFERLRRRDREANRFSDLDALVGAALDRMVRQSRPSNLMAIIQGFLYRSCLATVQGDVNGAAGASAMARRIYDHFTEQVPRALQERLNVPSFEVLQSTAHAHAERDLPGRLRGTHTHGGRP